MLESELLKVIQGTSALKPDMLNKKYEETEHLIASGRAAVEAYELELSCSKEMMEQVTREYNNVLTWADMYAESDVEVKKMIIAQIISAVRVSRGYKIEIESRAC